MFENRRLLTRLHGLLDHHSAVRIDHVPLGGQVGPAVVVGESDPKEGGHGGLCGDPKAEVEGLGSKHGPRLPDTASHRKH